jgi:outer membrane protein OmpA-like peptidoglycan-associated protein
MFKAIAFGGVALALWSAQLAFAQRGPATEAEALSYIYSAFLTQADPGVMGRQVVLGPELQRALALPASAQGANVYHALLSLMAQNSPDVRKATLQEVVDYGARRGFDRSHGPLYTLEAGALRFLIQYDLRGISIAFVGQLGVPDPEPRPAAVKVAPGFSPVAMRDERPRAEPLHLEWSAQFQFDSAELTADAVAALERDILPKLAKGAEIRFVHVSGHADRLGDAEYNRKLSEKRAEALRAYLVAKGVDQSKIEVFSYGTTLPAKDCGAKKGRALIECLAPNRRAVLEITAR